MESMEDSRAGATMMFRARGNFRQLQAESLRFSEVAREANFLRQCLGHPNISTLLGVYEVEGSLDLRLVTLGRNFNLNQGA